MESSHGHEKRNCDRRIEEWIAAPGGAGGIADALRTVHDSRVPRQRAEPGGDRARAREDPRTVSVKKSRAPGAGPFAVLDRRCADVAALRLPGAAGAVAQRDRQSRSRYPAVLAARRTRDRPNEQAARL